MSDTPDLMTHERIMTGEEYVSYSDYLLLQKERDEWKNKAYSHATDYTLMEAKCFRLEQQLKEYDQLKS